MCVQQVDVKKPAHLAHPNQEESLFCLCSVSPNGIHDSWQERNNEKPHSLLPNRMDLELWGPNSTASILILLTSLLPFLPMHLWKSQKPLKNEQFIL